MIYVILICFTLGASLCLIGFADSRRAEWGRVSSAAIKVFAYLFGVFGLCCIGTVFLLSYVGAGWEGMCADDVSEPIPSPDRMHLVYVFTRDCGATTTFSGMVSQVMLRDSSHPVQLQDQEIISRTDWLGREIDDIIYAGNFSDIEWVSNNRLEIRVDDADSGDLSWNNITVSYKPTAKLSVKPKQQRHKK